MHYYPKVTKKGEIDLEEISEQIAYSSSLTQADCYAVIINMIATVLSWNMFTQKCKNMERYSSEGDSKWQSIYSEEFKKDW